MSLVSRYLRVVTCDAADCKAEIVTEAGDAVAARFEVADLGWGFRTEKAGSGRGARRRVDLCPAHASDQGPQSFDAEGGEA